MSQLTVTLPDGKKVGIHLWWFPTLHIAVVAFNNCYNVCKSNKFLSKWLKFQVQTCPPALGRSTAAGTTDGPLAFDLTQGIDMSSAHARHCPH